MDAPSDPGALARRLNTLAAERTELFAKAARPSGLSPPERVRLKTLERELDECFVVRRQQRAARTALRFTDTRRTEQPRP